MPCSIEIGDDQALLGDRHGAGQSHDDETILVTGHCLQHIGGFSDLAASEGSFCHGAHQVVNRADLGEIERRKRNQLIADGVMQFALDASAFRVVFRSAVLHLLTSLCGY